MKIFQQKSDRQEFIKEIMCLRDWSRSKKEKQKILMLYVTDWRRNISNAI